MRLVYAFLLAALLGMSVSVAGSASALIPVPATSSAQALLHDAKIVCGDTGQGYKCRNEPGAVRHGKMRKIPGASDKPSEGLTEGGDPDALPPASGGAGAYQAPAAAPTSCPNNAELLGGHCIPYTQSCRKGLAANAPPQVCQGAEEKLVCDFRPDGLKDCCCRTYSKF